MGWLPAVLPAICELLNEIGLEGGGLSRKRSVSCPKKVSPSFGAGVYFELRTVKVGSSMEVDDSTAEETSLATEEAASLRTDWASALTVPASRAAAESAAVAWKRMAEQQQGNRSDRSRFQ